MRCRSPMDVKDSVTVHLDTPRAAPATFASRSLRTVDREPARVRNPHVPLKCTSLGKQGFQRSWCLHAALHTIRRFSPSSSADKESLLAGGFATHVSLAGHRNASNDQRYAQCHSTPTKCGRFAVSNTATFCLLVRRHARGGRKGFVWNRGWHSTVIYVKQLQAGT